MSLREDRYLAVKGRNVWRLRYALESLLERPKVSGHLLRIVAGHVTWASLVRRGVPVIVARHLCLYTGCGTDSDALAVVGSEGAHSVRAVLPLLRVGLQADWHPCVACTNASPFGLGVVRRKLS